MNQTVRTGLPTTNHATTEKPPCKTLKPAKTHQPEPPPKNTENTTPFKGLQEGGYKKTAKSGGK